ncbi:hypothetical protein D0Z07_5666 [Hyphodiscus hymeniophilus]|uniref:Mid2 domain-containing protein n=1 Tax=Hyphodiscus hymeniophilus TaxID=353542 RepID=A0A9P6VH96_9HELO|nr:hypothetical protein D0Z07_5666 [Hyphodiscus hymeniophilus]
MCCSSVYTVHTLVWIFGLILLNPSESLAFIQCYFPDGSIPTDYVWEPCTGAQYSSCCVPSEGDVCQENGLCYYPGSEQLYRGTCTDRTWDDPACNANICVTGYETTWNWAIECETSGSSSWACGNVTDNEHDTATCPGSAKTESILIQSTTTTSSGGRYTSPPPIDTALYSLYTDTYSITLSAAAQSTTFISAFESTLTSTLSHSTPTAGPTNAVASSTTTPVSSTKRVMLTTGVIVAIIVGPTLALALGVGLFFFMRKRSQRGVTRVNSLPHPPPNGPVGADQVNPYELPNLERKNREYSSTRVEPLGVHEVGGDQKGSQEEKLWGWQTAEMGGDDLRSPRSPAHRYSDAMAPVEMDGNSSFRDSNHG